MVIISVGDSQRIDQAVYVCEKSHSSHPGGIFYGESPLDFSFTLVLLEATLIIIIIRILHFVLKPLKQPRIVSEILGGVIIGPSVLGRNKTFSENVFPQNATYVFKNIGLIGFVYFLFLSGVKMDVTTIVKAGKKQLSVGLIGVLVPFLAVLCIALATRKSLDKELDRASSIGGISAALAITSFPVLYQIIKELNLLSSEVGKLAMSSVMFSDAVGVVCLVLFQATRAEPINALWVCIAFIVIAAIVGCARQAMVWIVKSTPEGEPVDQVYLLSIFLGVLVIAFLSDITGVALANSPLWLGLAVPDGPPLGSALVEGAETFVTEIFMPFSYAYVGMYTDVSSMIGQWSSLAPLFFMCTAAYLTKVITILVVGLYFEMPVRDSLALSLVMSFRGQLELLIFMHWMDLEMIQVPSFTMLVISTTIVTAITTPLISILYDPTRPYKVNKRRAIQYTPPNAELHIVACIHDQESVTGFINLLEVSNPSVTSPFSVYALRLIELVGRASPLFIDHDQQTQGFEHSGFNSVHNALKLFQESKGDYVKFSLFTTVSPTRTMYQDICELALTKKAILVILPYRKELLETRTDSVHPHILLRSVNCNVLSHAPCSVGVLVDNGPFMNNKVLVGSSMRRVTHRFAVVFLGGADAREALAFADRVAGNPDVSLTVVRFLSHNNEGDDEKEKKLDDGLVTWFWVKNEGNERVVYREVVVQNGEETITAIQLMNRDYYDLWIVGRKQGINPVLIQGLSNWSQNNELGVIGDFIASTELEIRASVLVVQQQVLRGEEVASGSLLRRFFSCPF